jgi:hypothetical protein
MMLRLASTPSVLQTRQKSDALLTLRLFERAAQGATFSKGNGSLVPGSGDVLATALLCALAPSAWDTAGYRFVLSDGDKSPPLRVQRSLPEDAERMTKMADDLELRAAFTVKNLVVANGGEGEKVERDVDGEDSSGDDRSSLASLLFQIVLLMYFSSNGFSTNDAESVLPTVFQCEAFQLLPLVCLPLLCENCPPEQLLSSVDGQEGIFEIMWVVFDCASARFDDTCPESPITNREVSPALRQLSVRLSSAVAVLEETLPEVVFSGPPVVKNVGADDEMVLSMCSILLSLLVSILELGAQQRSTEEESMLQSFSSVLRSLAEASPRGESGNALSVEQAQVSEMASHALALLASRGAPSERDGNQIQPPDAPLSEPTEEMILKAERDLASAEPPVRARGVVSLRHLANAVTEANRTKFGSEIFVLEDESKVERVLMQILWLSVKALQDTESYVYLAAVHTIVAVAGAFPQKIITLVGNGVATGNMQFSELAEDLELTLDQRVKLAEALIYIIRRKASLYEDIRLQRFCGKSRW